MQTLLIGLLLAFALPTAAETDPDALIGELEAKIAALQRQLENLKTQQTGGIGVDAFTKTLRRGARSSEVTRLQEFLTQQPGIYPEGLATGYFGALTEAAVKRFQKKYGIEAVGIVGPKTRAKLNELLPAPSVIPPPAPPPTSEPPAAPPPPPAPTPPPAPPPAPPAPPPAPPPTPAELGQPMLNLAVWGRGYFRITFTHDPTSKTRGYITHLRRPGDALDTTFGPYGLISIDEVKTFADGTIFKRASFSGWELTTPFDLAANPEGAYAISVTASGDGNAEGFVSPARPLTLQAKAVFADLYQGPSNQAVLNNTVSTFPLTMRLTNFDPSLYYRYTILDGGAIVWESSYTSNTQSSQVQVSFPNSGNYPFGKGKSYRIRVDSFDNNTGGDSVIKQKSNEMTFTYSPS